MRQATFCPVFYSDEVGNPMWGPVTSVTLKEAVVMATFYWNICQSLLYFYLNLLREKV